MVSRARANVEVVRCLRRLDAEQRPATPAEQAVLARWSGWGAVPQMFDPADGRFAELRGELRGLLDADEWQAAARNTLNAHYTDASLVAAIWGGLGQLGFDSGRVLEPGCGAGVFLGLAPPQVEAVGVELDPTTAAVAAALYPDAQVRCESFADTRIPERFFDATVGNVPFGRFALHDPVHNRGGHSIHNHFVVKALHLTRPGGMVAVLTSRYTLDARNPGVRREIAELGDLVGAVRLPEGAHRRAAGTDVVTDLLVLRRRYPGDPPWGAPFEQVQAVDVAGGRAEINEYFAAHPDRVLGELYVGRGVYGDGELLVAGDPEVAGRLADTLAEVAAEAAAGGLTFGPRVDAAPDPVALVAAGSRRPEGFLAAAGEGFTEVLGGVETPFAVPGSQRAELRQLLGIRDTMVGLLEAEAASRDDSAAIVALRGELNDRYDTYVAAYGPLNRCTWRRTGRVDPQTGEPRLARIQPRRGGFRSDPFAAAVDALERYDPEDGRATKAPIFRQRVVAPPQRRLGADTPADALAICLDTHGHVDVDEIGRLLGVDPDQARVDLGELVFDDPEDGRLVPAAEYLSGDVRRKLAAAQVAADDDPRFAANVAALRAVVPEDLGPDQIDGRLGAAWIDASYVRQFLRETLDDPSLKVEHLGGSEWTVRGGRHGVLATSTWGTRRRPAGDLAESLLRQAPVTVSDALDDGRRVPNPTETVAAQEKAVELGQRFAEWLWEEPDRTEALARAYNDRFNALVLRRYDHDERTFPGLVLSFLPRPHQIAAVNRMVHEPATLLAHVVGAGKTAEMAMGLMEMRRLGMISKPAVVVPNHMVTQFAGDFAELYPQARLLVATREDMAGPEGRRRFVARAAVGEWDAVIVAQSAFERIPLGAEHRRRYLAGEVDRLRTWLDRASEQGGLSVKRVERQLVAAEEKIKSRLETGKADDGVTFELTGIDYLCVDEAHLYKNLRTDSSIPDAKIDGSQRAQDLDMKIDWLRRRSPGGRSVTFATATPVANSVTETYVMQRYLRPDLLATAGIEDFDTWAATFGEVVAGVELSPDGSTFRMKSRFAKFTNVPELLKMFHVAADVKTAEDLDLPTPALAGDAPETVVVPATTELRALVEQLGRRADAVRARTVRPDEDNMLSISTDGRAGALDLRLLKLPRPHGPTKIDVAAETIASIWAEHRHDLFVDADGEPDPVPGSLQLVFADLGTPQAGWNVYDELRDQLVARGLPRDAVRFVHDATNDRAKAELFAACRSGRVAVLVGSTEKMGVGTNVQERAVALHHLDCPWRPADLAQREGRILRQGNQHPQVRILRYVTEGSFDTYLWQTVERKARFIGQLMRGRLDTREIDDIGADALSYAEVKALAAGDPRLIEKAQVDSDLARLERLSRAWARNQDHLTRRLAAIDTETAGLHHQLADTQAALERRIDTHGDHFTMDIAGHHHTVRAEAGAELLGHLRRHIDAGAGRRGAHDLGQVATLGGQPVVAAIYADIGGPTVAVRLDGVPRSDITLTAADLQPERAATLISRLERRLDRLDTLPTTLQADLDNLTRERTRAQTSITDRFPHADRLDQLHTRATQLNAELAAAAAQPPDPQQSSIGGELVAAAYPAGPLPLTAIPGRPLSAVSPAPQRTLER